MEIQDTMNDFKNTLYYGDNLDILKELTKQYPQGLVDLIYIDPPFNSKRNYNILFEDLIQNKENGEKNIALKEAFIDTWSNVEISHELEELKSYTDIPQLYRFLENNREIFSSAQMSYLTMMTHRLYYMRKILKDTGSLYLHCDPTMSHYLKLVLDIIFGKDNFRNEIVWHYRTGGTSKSYFARKHDIIFFYVKNHKTPYLFNALTMKQYYDKKPSFLDKNSGCDEKGYYNIVQQDTVWNIKSVFNLSHEFLGYPTQKPESLLERIIKASSNENDIVADFFCGCGTAITVAEKFKRKWLGVDINHLAISLVEEKRLIPLESKYQVIGFPKDIAGAEKLAQDNKLKFEEWIVEYKFRGHKTKSTGDGGIDGHITFNSSGKKLLGVIEVKGGNVTISQIRAFKDSIFKFNADLGIFIAFKKYLTKGMYEEADKLGFVSVDKKISNSQSTFYSQGDMRIKKMYIIAVDDLMENKLPSELIHIGKDITYG